MRIGAANAAFVLAGIAYTMVGPLLPTLQSRWGLDDARAGLLFPAQFLASSIATASVGWLARGRGYFGLLPYGALLIAVGSACLGFLNWPAGLVAIALYGAGFGLMIPAGNLSVAGMFPEASARPLTYLNLSWSAGAVFTPWFVMWLPERFPMYFAAIALVMTGFLSAIARNDGPPRPLTSMRTHWSAAAMLFLYVGAEAAVNGWMPSRAERDFGGGSWWAATPSLFWAAILVGRIVTPAVLRHVAVPVLLIWSTFGALAGSLLIAVDPRPVSLLPGGVLAGLSMSAIYPLVISQYAGGRAPGFVFAMGGLGGALLPLLVGAISEHTHSLRFGMALIPLALAALLWLAARK